MRNLGSQAGGKNSLYNAILDKNPDDTMCIIAMHDLSGDVLHDEAEEIRGSAEYKAYGAELAKRGRARD